MGWIDYNINMQLRAGLNGSDPLEIFCPDCDAKLVTVHLQYY